jgi:hypothetical protein
MSEELKELLKNHDSYYDYSDDMAMYSRGRDQKEAIVRLVMSLENLIYSKALIRYKELINA